MATRRQLGGISGEFSSIPLPVGVIPTTSRESRRTVCVAKCEDGNSGHHDPDRFSRGGSCSSGAHMDGGGGGVISGQSARMPAIITGSPRFAVGVGTLHLDFPSRMYLPRFGGAFRVWRGSLFRECVLYPLISASPLTPSRGRGFSCNMTANDNQISQEIQNWDPVCGG